MKNHHPLIPTNTYALKLIAALFFLVLIISPKISHAAADVEWYPIAKDVYQLRYEDYYTIFVVTNKGVVAFDPLSNSAAEHLVHAIKAVAPKKKLLAIIYSHWHTDHATGASVLQQEFGRDVAIIAHERTLARLKKRADKNIPLPTQVVGDSGGRFQYGNTEIELHYLGFGHTNTMLVTRLPKQNLIYVVDFVNHDSIAWRDMPGVPVNELIAMQKRLLNLKFEKVAFAHGRSGPGDRMTIERQINYFNNILSEVKVANKNGQSVEDTVTTVALNLPQYRGWKNYKEWFQLNVRGVYQWLKEQ